MTESPSLFADVRRKLAAHFVTADRGLLRVCEFVFGPRPTWLWWQRRLGLPYVPSRWSRLLFWLRRQW